MDYLRQSSTSWRLAGLLCLSLVAPLLHAATQSLFETEVPVADQRPATRSSALSDALGEVLVRVTGSRQVLDSEAGRTLLGSPERLVQQYRYFTEAQQEPPQLKLWVRFDGDAVRHALQQQGSAYWGNERPDTLVWLAVEDRGRRYLVASDIVSDVRQQVELAARQRGVTLLFPLMDLEDQTQVRFADVWGGFFDKVRTASARYSPAAVLIGRLNRSPSGGWTARWEMTVSGRTHSWTDSNQALDELARQGVDDVADMLASSLAVAGGNGYRQTVSISVAGIETLAAYARINGYLASLSPVKELQVAGVTPDSVGYTLQLNGTMDDFTRMVVIGRVLEPAGDGVPGNFRLRQ